MKSCDWKRNGDGPSGEVSGGGFSQIVPPVAGLMARRKYMVGMMPVDERPWHLNMASPARNILKSLKQSSTSRYTWTWLDGILPVVVQRFTDDPATG